MSDEYTEGDRDYAYGYTLLLSGEVTAKLVEAAARDAAPGDAALLRAVVLEGDEWRRDGDHWIVPARVAETAPVRTGAAEPDISSGGASHTGSVEASRPMEDLTDAELGRFIEDAEAYERIRTDPVRRLHRWDVRAFCIGRVLRRALRSSRRRAGGNASPDRRSSRSGP